jgi:syntaxin 1B/2/3
MASLGQAHEFSESNNTANSNPILNECRLVDAELNLIHEDFIKLKVLHRRYLDGVELDQESQAYKDFVSLNSKIQSSCQILDSRIQSIDGLSRNPIYAPQVDRLDGKLKLTVNEHRQIENELSKMRRTQLVRRHEIVGRSEDEALDMIDQNPDQQIFQQIMLVSDRQGRSRQTLDAVEDRHTEIQQIEGQMMEVGQAMGDIAKLVVAQDLQVTKIEQHSESTNEQIEKSVPELDKANGKARDRNRRKRWCLLLGKFPVNMIDLELIEMAGVVSLIIVIIIVVILVMTQVVNK